MPDQSQLSTDPRTPVVVGVGQSSERLGAEDYQGLSPVDLAAAAAREALADTGADPASVAAAIDTVAGIRQFENSFPRARAPLGRSDNYPRSVAGRIAATPARAVLEVSGGQAPQHLVNEFARVIAAGDSEVTLVFGSDWPGIPGSIGENVAALRGLPLADAAKDAILGGTAARLLGLGSAAV